MEAANIAYAPGDRVENRGVAAGARSRTAASLVTEPPPYLHRRTLDFQHPAKDMAVNDSPTPVPPPGDRAAGRPQWDVADMHDSINPFSPWSLSRYLHGAALLAALALIVPQRWLAWTLGTFALLTFLVGEWMTWRFAKATRPLDPYPPEHLESPPTAPLPSRWERRFEAIVAVTMLVPFALWAIAMGVVVWQFWKVGLTHLR